MIKYVNLKFARDVPITRKILKHYRKIYMMSKQKDTPYSWIRLKVVITILSIVLKVDRLTLKI